MAQMNLLLNYFILLMWCHMLFSPMVEFKQLAPFPWNVPWTIHALLDHFGELIEANRGKGIGTYTESSLESCNKFLRLYRISLSRKTNQIDNLQDCKSRLWIRLDIHVHNAIPKNNVWESQYQNIDFKDHYP